MSGFESLPTWRHRATGAVSYGDAANWPNADDWERVTVTPTDAEPVPVTVTAELGPVAAVRALHVPVHDPSGGDWCYSCEYTYPCPTTLALDDAGVSR